MHKINTFEKLFLVLMSDIYAVEVHLVNSLPEIAKKAQSQELKEALLHHLKETKNQLARLERIYKMIGESPEETDWLSQINGLFEKGKRFLENADSSNVTDAALIAYCQRIEHLEMATYGTLKEYASVMEFEEIKDLLNESLKEEIAADTLLTKLAEGGVFKTGINVKATAHR